MATTLNTPLLAWGTPENIQSGTGWSTGGTVTVTPATDPFGTSLAYKVDDTSAAAASYRQRTLPTLPAGTNWFQVWTNNDTETIARIAVRDTTAGVDRHLVRITFAGGVPSLSTDAGGGTLLTPVWCDTSAGGWYCLEFGVNGMVAANTHVLRLYPTSATVGDTGSTHFYIRNTVIAPPLDTVTAWPEPREGSETARVESGAVDAWTVGTDYHMVADLGWIPQRGVSTPLRMTGWDGLAEQTGVNVGVGALLTAGRDKQTIDYAPDRTVPTTYIPSELAEPMTGGPTVERDGSRRVTLHLRNTTVEYPVWT